MTTTNRDNILKYIIEHPCTNDSISFSDFEGLYKVFSAFSRNEIDQELIHLTDLEYISAVKTTSGMYIAFILPKGRAYIDDKTVAESAAAKAKAEERKETKRIERNQWIQFWIPLAVSILALIISIVK